jgi:hypothetical protein
MKVSDTLGNHALSQFANLFLLSCFPHSFLVP